MIGLLFFCLCFVSTLKSWLSLLAHGFKKASTNGLLGLLQFPNTALTGGLVVCQDSVQQETRINIACVQ